MSHPQPPPIPTIARDRHHKFKELDLRVEPLVATSKHNKRKTTEHIKSFTPADLSTYSRDDFHHHIRFLTTYSQSILDNLDHQIRHSIIDVDEYHSRLKSIETIDSELSTLREKISHGSGSSSSSASAIDRKMDQQIIKIENELRRITKYVSPRSLSLLFPFFIYDVQLFLREISPEYHELYNIFQAFFQPLSAELITEDREIENIHKIIHTQSQSLPGFPSVHALALVPAPTPTGSAPRSAPLYRINAIRHKTLDEKIEGLTIYFPNPSNSSLISIYGIFKKDSLLHIKRATLFAPKVKELEDDMEYLDMPPAYKKLYLSQIPSRDFIALTHQELIHLMKADYEELSSLKNKNISILIKEFLRSPIEKQRRIINLFIMYGVDSQFIAHTIYDLILNQNITSQGTPLSDLIYQSLHWKVQILFRSSKSAEEDAKKKITNFQLSDVPYDQRIANLAAGDHVKAKACEKLKEINGSKDNSVKAQQWLDGLLKIPFGVYKEEKIIRYFEQYQGHLSNYVDVASTKITAFDETQLNGKNKKLYNLLIDLLASHKTKILHHSDNEYDQYVERAKELLIKYMIYLPMLMVDVKFEYNKEKMIQYQSEIYAENQFIHKISEEEEKEENVPGPFPLERARRFNLESSGLRVGKERTGSVDLTDEELLKEMRLDTLSERNKEIVMKMIETQSFPNSDLLKKSMDELTEVRRMKENLLKQTVSSASAQPLNHLMDKLTEIEKNLIERSHIKEGGEGGEEEESVNTDEDDEEDEQDPVNTFFRKFAIKNFHEIEDLVIGWMDFKKSKKEYMKYMDKTLDKCVHGHLESKQQIKRLVGQMMASKKKKGFCLGLQGPPGVGKTTICLNGLAKCLIDENGESRPIIFLPLGGSANGSTLEGHNYTYLGSTWGKIADALMEAKCMNPIIFIDELDKISKTEHGREIASILTHVTDQTQNTEFFDKYFQSIPLDLSKVIFIFSYNDRNNVDKILLDRIQEVKIEPLSKQDKVIISKNYVLPEIYRNTGFSKDEIIFPSRILSNIIENYTFEAGVRKLSEILNDIIREINLRRIMGTEYEFPITINEALVDEILGDRPKMSYDKILSAPLVGVSYGMYASSAGYGGGISKIQTVFVPSSSSSKKIAIQKTTGLAGEMMKESFDVCMSVAYNLIPDGIKKELEKREDNGIHIHFNDSSVNKDGPSGGQAITLSIVSLLTNTKIRNNVAITGEINLLGFAMKIGGLPSKINGSIRAGINTFIVPKENKEDIIQMIRTENRTKKNLAETYGGLQSSSSLNQGFALQKTSSFLNLDYSVTGITVAQSQSSRPEEMDFEESEEYPGVEMIYYKHCKVYLVDNIYQVLQIALIQDSDGELPVFKELF